MMLLSLTAGLALLVAGGDILVRGAVAVARRLGLPPLFIGLTLVGLGTSMPELVTSLEAAMIGAPGIAVGNIVGSNTANILLILGVAAVIRPVATSPSAFGRDGGMMLLAALAAVAIAVFGHVDRLAGLALVAALAAYLVFTYRRESRGPEAEAMRRSADRPATGLARGLLMSAAGLALTIGGAALLVDGAVALARIAGISESVVGVTVVAFGTSLPELVATVAAAVRRQADVAFGNVIGSNIYNVFGILGATALVHPIPVPRDIAGFDVWVMLAATLLLLVFAVTRWRVSRWEGAVFLACYALYVGWLGVTASGAGVVAATA